MHNDEWYMIMTEMINYKAFAWLFMLIFNQNNGTKNAQITLFS